MTDTATVCHITLPEWVSGFIESWSGDLETGEDRMRLAIALSAENVARGSGGPFGAIVFDTAANKLISVGVNLVTNLNISCAHAEIVALSLAQRQVGDWNLASGGEIELTSSCEPCAMCFGAVPWSGVSRLVYGANRDDAEAVGFDEGDKPQDWHASLTRRGITVEAELLRREAAAVFDQYQESGGVVYTP